MTKSSAFKYLVWLACANMPFTQTDNLENVFPVSVRFTRADLKDTLCYVITAALYRLSLCVEDVKLSVHRLHTLDVAMLAESSRLV